MSLRAAPSGHGEPVSTPVTGGSPGRLGYHPSLDGVRALSVAAVVLYHADQTWVPGGFLGVEVFFVVSGFLITALLVEERHRSGTISLKDFWVRRARRLLPALYALLLVVPAFMLVFWRDAAGRMGGDVVSSLLYVNNWWQIHLDESYFAQAGRPPVLRHLWSLAIEEQFYLLFPPFFVFLLARGRRLARNTLIALALASAAWMAILFEPFTDPSRVYYGTDTRASGMLLGAVLALVWAPWRAKGRPARSAGPVLDVLGVAAIVVLLWSFHRVNAFDPFVYRGGFLLVDITVVVLLAVLVHPASRLSRVLALTPLVWIGVRSYSIYLWHWPVFMVTRPQLDVPFTGLPLLVLRIGIMLALAMASYRFIEQPIRNGALGRWRQRLRDSRGEERVRLHQRAYLQLGGLAAAVVLVTAGLVSAANSDDRQRLELEVVAADVVGAEEGAPPVVLPATLDAEDGDVTVWTDDGVAPGGASGDATVSGAAGAAATEVQGLAVGDSVMLGASGQMQQLMPGLRIDAKVARQFNTLVDAALWYHREGLVEGPLIIQVGNNGVAQQSDLDRLLKGVEGTRVLLVNTKVPRPWESITNDRVAAAAARWDNAEVVDWYSLAVEHPEWFVADGTHLRPAGQVAYAELIRSHL